MRGGGGGGAALKAEVFELIGSGHEWGKCMRAGVGPPRKK